MKHKRGDSDSFGSCEELSAPSRLLFLSQARFPDHKKKTLTRFLMGFGMSAEKAIPAYEAHLKW